MSQHSAASTTTNTTTAVTTTTTSEESCVKPGSSSTGSLKKQKHKDAEVPLTDDFVLMSAPDKFKDKNINECNVVKRHRSDASPNEKINLECLLLSDTSLTSGIPQHVEVLLQHFNNTQLTQAEILFLLVYIVALESGFVGLAGYEQAKLYLEHLLTISSFHAKNVLRLSHLKPNYNLTEDKTRFCLKLRTLINMQDAGDYVFALLTGFVTGDFLIVTLTPATSTCANGFSLALSIGRYVLSMQSKNKPLYQRFHKLDELSNILRDQLFVPMRCHHIRLLQGFIYTALDGLPVELYDHIFKYLSKNQLKILANVNKSLYDSVKGSKFTQKYRDTKV
ncbi:protein nutcracker [Calliphora vicina]|uniref:protein nutcracker n=1 Tax=Calliphora vicina TaxID=7373 RepID=UPI00325BDBD1